MPPGNATTAALKGEMGNIDIYLAKSPAVSTGGAAVVAVVSAAVSFFAHAASANRAATMPMVVRTTGTIDDMGTLSVIRDGV